MPPGSPHPPPRAIPQPSRWRCGYVPGFRSSVPVVPGGFRPRVCRTEYARSPETSTETSLKPPTSAGLEERVRCLKPRRSGVAGVHFEEFAGEEGGLVAAGSGPDLQYYVLIVVRVAVYELGPEFAPPALRPAPRQPRLRPRRIPVLRRSLLVATTLAPRCPASI